jgi:hypothetical protein
MADMCYYGNVTSMVDCVWLFYIFNSTVIDWTCYFIIIIIIIIIATKVRLMNRKFCSTKLPLTNLRLFPNICLEKQQNTSVNLADFRAEIATTDLLDTKQDF